MLKCSNCWPRPGVRWLSMNGSRAQYRYPGPAIRRRLSGRSPLARTRRPIAKCPLRPPNGSWLTRLCSCRVLSTGAGLLTMGICPTRVPTPLSCACVGERPTTCPGKVESSRHCVCSTATMIRPLAACADSSLFWRGSGIRQRLNSIRHGATCAMF